MTSVAVHDRDVTPLSRQRAARLLLWALLLIQAAAAVWLTRPWLGGDSPVYLQLAENLRHYCFGLVQAGGCQPDPLRPPGYPLILAAELHALHLPLGAIACFQAALYLASLGLIEAVLLRWRIASIPFLLAALIYPFGGIYSAFIMTEAWATLALSACAYLVCRKELELKTLVVLGFAAGGAALIRADFLLLPLLLAWLVALGQRGRGGFASAGAVVAAASLVILPYGLWNAEHFDKPSPAPIASAVGNTLYLAFWQSQLSHDDLDPLYKGVVTAPVRATGLVPEIMRLNRSIGAPPMTVPFNPADYSDPQVQVRSTRVFGRAAVAHIEAEPADYLRHVAANIWLLWNTSIYPAALPKLARLALRAISAIVCAGGVLGLFVALRSNRRRQFMPAVALLLYLPAIHVWLHTEARYTAAARPLLLMFAGLFLSWCWERSRSRRVAAVSR